MPSGDRWLEGSVRAHVAWTVLPRDWPFLHKYMGFGSALQAPENLNIVHTHGSRQDRMIQDLHLSTEAYVERSEALSSQRNIYEKTK